MDAVINSALEVICSQGINGVSITVLWSHLNSTLSSSGLPLCSAVKRAIWSGLVQVPGLQFWARDGSEFDLKSKSVEECEGLDVKILGNEQLRGCFVGLYDVKASNITPPQQRVLERLALARGNGVTQNQLCKEFGIPANNFFYVVKRLESWGLVVRKSTIVRTKETSSDKDPKKSPVHTNLVHLRRYTKALGSHQRLEITKDNKTLDESFGEDVAGADECGPNNVLVKDFLPALKAICDRLEHAEGKVLVVSDIKRELGYRETQGHRAWRNICNRLKQAGLVEVFEAKVDNKMEATTDSKKSKSKGQSKPVSCLRLLKKFSPRLFEKTTPECEYGDHAMELTSGNRLQNTDQLVELPLEQQMFDMIEDAGSKGLLGVEVCSRLGISNRMFDNLSSTLVHRYGLHQLSESHKRGSAYRFWTWRNFNAQLPNTSSSRSDAGHDEHESVSLPVEEPSYPENVRKTDVGSSTVKGRIPGNDTAGEYAEHEQRDCSQEDQGPKEMVVWSKYSRDSTHDMSITVPVSVTMTETNSKLVEYSSCTLSKSLNLQPGQRYPSVTSAQRELRILERLKTDKIILRPELQRWVESFEKDNNSRMDRKTLQRCLKKLEQEGHCKLIDFSIPGVTNFGRHRDTVVVLHPSFEGSTTELSGQVHERWRLFEMQIRGSLSQQSKKVLPVPVLHGIERIQNNSSSDAQIGKSEAMRANGFVLAKMVRTKLLHLYLWGYVTNLSQLIEASRRSNSRNPHSSCLLFNLDAAIKAIPLELFLQVVGSALKLKDMTEKCKNGILLSDLPDEEYKSLMDTRATGRLSWLIDILRRLKLIRLVTDDSSSDGAKISHATLVYALELKPYIEEPPSKSSLPRCSGSCDLRPHCRHDFVLSTSEAVDKYWQTLEYCYASADPKAALLAFPGSVVHEICFYKSWTTIRVMTAEQREKLLEHIKDQPNKKLTFNECRAIAKSLKLTLEQVLRVYHDNRLQRVNTVQGDLDVENADLNDRQHQSKRKRKISSERRNVKVAKTSQADIQESHVDSQAEIIEEPSLDKQQEDHESLIDQCIMPMMKQTRQPKFSWTEEADRQLIIQYARQRAIQGAKRGTDWASIGDLPAPAHTCRRRIAVLNMDINFRKSIMRLCNLLTQRYAQWLNHERNLSGSEGDQDLDSHREHWDDFDNYKIKTALNEVLLHKKMIKPDATKRTAGPTAEATLNPISNTHCELKDSDQQEMDSSQKSRIRRLPKRFVRHLKEGVCITSRVNQSLAISSAVELFKLVFLTTTAATEMPCLLAETLRCYSEHDLYSAFDYLRQEKIMIGRDTSQPFALSQHFLRSLSMSQFPANTGRRAAKLDSWIHDKGDELTEGMVNLPADLQCGDIYHLFALVSSGELSILPLLPDEGVGETEDSRSSKRKSDHHEFEDCGMSKKHKVHSLQESEIFSRREKGFPGITVSLSRKSVTSSDIVELFKDDNKNLLLSENNSFFTMLGRKVSRAPSILGHAKDSAIFGSILPDTVIRGDSQWEVMANYTVHLMSKHSEQEDYAPVHPELIKTAYKTIQKAGDQGLSMSKFYESMGMQGTILDEYIIDVLQSFGLILKVNSYDSVHVVDGLYRTKYFLTSKSTHFQDPEKASSSFPQMVDNTVMTEGIENCEDQVDCTNRDDVHKVTILSLSEDVSQHSNALQDHNKLEECGQSERMSIIGRRENQKLAVSTASFQPILPWINGDGTINGIVYRGLTRRIMGIVTQNPGILEDNIISHMEVLNPQSCRQLIELLVLEKHLIVRKMTQCISSGPPALLGCLVGNSLTKPKFICRQHYFANCMSSTLL